jgi:beta-lactamase regulating signal transducer with metallopeptidase domain
MGLTNAALASLLALAAFLIGRACRRPAITHTLWILVLLKLLTPPLISVPAPWPSALTTPAANADRTSARDSAVAHEELLTEEDDILLEDETPGGGVSALAALPPASLPSPGSDDETTAGAAQQGDAHLAWIGVLWLAGSAVWLGMAGIRIVGFQRLLGYGRPAPAELQAEAQLLALRLGLPRCPELWIVPGRISPLLWALGGRVRLVLPAELLSRLRPEQQATLLAHELAHALRHDHWVRWLELLATGLYWWHPVAWWARHEIQHAEEQCCDAWVVWLLPTAAKAYAKALLQTVDFLDARPALPPVASGVGHMYHLKRRLTMIVRDPLSPRLPWTLHLGTIVLGLMVLPLAPVRLEAQSSSETVANLLPDESQATTKPGEDPGLRDLDRRLRALERRMDRVLRSLEEGRGGRRVEEKIIIDDDKKTTDRARESAEKKQKLRKEVEEKVKTARNKAKKEAERVKEFNLRFDIEGFDPERMKGLEKQIEAAVKEAVNPERLKRMEKEIEETINKSINPERMKQLEKQIESLVERNVNPQRMEALAKQIESLVSRSLRDEGREHARQAERAAKPKAPSARAERAKEGGDRYDLERRLDQLEQKMDRVLKALESSRRQ